MQVSTYNLLYLENCRPCSLSMQLRQDRQRGINATMPQVTLQSFKSVTDSDLEPGANIYGRYDK